MANGRPSAEEGWECIAKFIVSEDRFVPQDELPKGVLTTAELNARTMEDAAPPQNDGGPESSLQLKRGVPRAEPVYHCEACNTWITGPSFLPEPGIRPLCPVCRKNYPLFGQELKARPFTYKVMTEHPKIYVG